MSSTEDTTEDTVAEDYESLTVVELREELADRGLPTSGHKDELIARLEEDDAKEAAETSTEEVEEQAEDVPADPYKRIYSPFELPADPFAAQAFKDAHPDDVDESVEIPPEQVAQAQANIQDSVDQHATMGTVVEDPRLEGYTPGPHIDSLNPASAPTGEQVTITVSGSGFADTSSVEIDGTGQSTTFVDAHTLTVSHQPAASGTEIFTVRNSDDQESNNMSFSAT
jgi:hypothetical protein